jgi:transcriptional regulator with XRE-family HTH domain
MRTTTSSHPLARLRAIVGWTREECARVGGMTAANVQNVELGRTRLPEDAAGRIQAATGCKADSLLQREDVPLGMDGAAYSRRAYTEWTENPVGTVELESALKDYHFRISALLATARKSPAKFRQAATRIHQHLHALPAELGISQGDLTELARSLADTTIRSLTFAELKDALKNRATFMTSQIEPTDRADLISGYHWDPDNTSGEIFDLTKALAGKNTRTWAKKSCQLATKVYQIYPHFTIQGTTVASTSYTTLRVEAAITLPDQSSLSFTFTFAQIPLAVVEKTGEVAVVRTNLVLPA